MLLFVSCYLLVVIITAIQWLPTLHLISESARSVDLNWQQEGWFIPWQHLVQFIVPDFFGNPTTLNYWGAWNYAEFVGYVGIAPLVLAFFALFSRKDKKTFFFGAILLFSFLFALPTGISSLPFQLQIPFLSTAQPTRLLFLVDFSLAVLAGFGFDFLLKQENKRRIFYSLAFTALIFGIIIAVSFLGTAKSISPENIAVIKSNLRLPLVTFFVVFIIFFLLSLKKVKRIHNIAVIVLLVVVSADLMRFGLKFTSFSNREYLYPSTKTLEFLQNQKGQFRIMTTDERILPPNFSIMYKIATIDGYDPLYLRRYGELIAASERDKPDISPPFGFNRIITPQNYNSRIIDLLGVKYVLSLSDLDSPKLTKVFQEGETRVYENKNVLPRVFFAEQFFYTENKEKAIEAIFRDDIDLRKVAITEMSLSNREDRKPQLPPNSFSAQIPVIGTANIVYYSENRVVVETDIQGERGGFLVLTDSFYPTWRAKIVGDYEIPVVRVDYNFRGISVPKGKHLIEFYNNLL